MSKTLTDAIATVRELLQDVEGFDTFSESRIIDAIEEATRTVGNRVGRNTLLASVSIVKDQQSYELPFTPRRLIEVMIAAEGSYVSLPPIYQVPLADIPVGNASQSGPPKMFAVNLTGGANADEYELIFWPIPNAPLVDGIKVKYEAGFTFSSANLLAPIPYPKAFYRPMMYYAAAFLYAESSESTDQQLAVVLSTTADQLMGAARTVDAENYYRPAQRVFP